MLPGLSAAPLLARPRSIVERRKLTNLLTFYNNDRRPKGDVALFSNGKQTKGNVNPTPSIVELISGSRYSAVGVLLGGVNSSNWDHDPLNGTAGFEWEIVDGSYASETFICCGFNLPEGRPPRNFTSADVLWSGASEGTGALNLTIPTSTEVTVPSIIVAGYGSFNTSTNRGMTTIWDAPELPDITAQRTGDYGIVTSIKASAYTGCGVPPSGGPV
ncbi:hypothetical protein [Paracoccus albus]|uniref:hypothetical protein n=1 Tax=Paracoccus albus TaxID=3017784 RepID=UPI0022F1381E|nr:hypothetical protein [Paracoccus albus]WBU61253.1 hypothetical protein PAF20_04925 [Paracoccus albus]